MRIVVTGTRGQLARCLAKQFQGHSTHNIVLLGRPDLDLTHRDSIIDAIGRARPDIVVSAAAYTAVDKAETEIDLAFAINADGAGHVADAARRCGAPVIHLSTDYVFAGDKDGPYLETDPTGPKTAYGRSKLAGEQAVAAANPRSAILRTAWVYSTYGRNFVKTMLELARTRDEISVVADQIGNPTSAHDIAAAIAHIIEHDPDMGEGSLGLFHLAGSGEATWADFALKIFETSASLGGVAASVRSITTKQYPTPAPRPRNSRLSCERFHEAFAWRTPDWRDSCRSVVATLVAEQASSG